MYFYAVPIGCCSRLEEKIKENNSTKISDFWWSEAPSNRKVRKNPFVLLFYREMWLEIWEKRLGKRDSCIFRGISRSLSEQFTEACEKPLKSQSPWLALVAKPNCKPIQAKVFCFTKTKSCLRFEDWWSIGKVTSANGSLVQSKCLSLQFVEDNPSTPTRLAISRLLGSKLKIPTSLEDILIDPQQSDIIWYLKLADC